MGTLAQAAARCKVYSPAAHCFSSFESEVQYKAHVQQRAGTSIGRLEVCSHDLHSSFYGHAGFFVSSPQPFGRRSGLQLQSQRTLNTARAALAEASEAPALADTPITRKKTGSVALVALGKNQHFRCEPLFMVMVSGALMEYFEPCSMVNCLRARPPRIVHLERIQSGWQILFWPL